MDKELIERLAHEADAVSHETEMHTLHRFASLIAKECANLCEAEHLEYPATAYNEGVADCAAAIRAKFLP